MTRGEALSCLVAMFRQLQIEDAAREARRALCAACGVDAAVLAGWPELPLGAAVAGLIEVASRRANGEPLSRIVCRREFWGLPISISRDVLDPRPETETLVETALSLLRDRRSAPLRILDLGIGSGAILCALLHELPRAQGIGVDISPAAVRVARSNIERCGCAERATIGAGNWTDNVSGAFDLIVSNPPYVRTADIDRLPPEVRNFDPVSALDGGDDGLDAYRSILPRAAKLLAPNGWLLAELGQGQAANVLALAEAAGFHHCMVRKDLAGLDRVVAGSLQKAGREPPA